MDQHGSCVRVPGPVRSAALKAAVLATALISPAAHSAAKCEIHQVLQLPITMDRLRPTVDVGFNGKPAKLVLDSGAAYSILTADAIPQYGLRTTPVPFGFYMTGIGGPTNVELTTVKEFTFAGITAKNAQFLVGGSSVGSSGLLGQNLLRLFDVEYDLGNGVIRFFKTKGCDDALLAYWLKPQQAYSSMPLTAIEPGNPHTMGSGLLNGRPLRIAFDTGAYNSVLSQAAAARAGITADMPGVQDAGYSVGIGHVSVKAHMARFASFKIGDSEEIKNTPLRFLSADLGFADMLLGADFFVSHRIFVANKEHKVFLSFNGGAVFDLAKTPLPAAPAPAEADIAPAPVAPQPPQQTPLNAGDAADLARRGAALAARHDFPAAIESLTQAIGFNPGDPEYFYERANAYRSSGQEAAALADYERAIALDAHFLPAYIPHAQLELQAKDREAALADLRALDRLAPPSADLRYTMADMYHRLGPMPEAIEQIGLWIANHPDDARIPSALGRRCLDRALHDRELKGALEDCDGALRGSDKKEIGTTFLYFCRGLVELRLGDYAKARTDFDRRLAAAPRDAETLYARGVVEARVGKAPESTADLTSALAAAPNVAKKFEGVGIAP